VPVAAVPTGAALAAVMDCVVSVGQASVAAETAATIQAAECGRMTRLMAGNSCPAAQSTANDDCPAKVQLVRILSKQIR
jgi:hypothetical protein